MTLERSVGVLVVRDRTVSELIGALDGYFRQWDFRRHQGVRAQLLAQRPAESREYVSHDHGTWVGIHAEHLPDLFEVGYAISKKWSHTPIIVSRAYAHGYWDCKAYLDRDILMKVGDDPDHELPWVGRPLDEESLPGVVQKLGGAYWRAFLEAVLRGRVRPRDLQDIIGVEVTVPFDDVYQQAPERYLAWFRN